MTFHRIKAVALRELSASAASPAAWVFLIIFLVLAGFCAFVAGNVFASGQADISPFFDWIPYLFLLIVPALAMPMWAEERRVGVFELTLSFPASLWELVIGKYLAGMILLAVALLLTFSIPLTAWVLGSPDTGAILCGYAGALLLGSVYLAMSSFCSALSRSQTASFLLSVFLCGVFLFIGLPSLLGMASAWLPDWLTASIASCSFLPNFQGYQKGLIDSAEVVYAVTLTGLFLSLTCFVLEFASSGFVLLTAPGAFSDPALRRALKALVRRSAYALVLTVALNIIAGTWQLRVDVSSDRAYSISEAAARIAADPGMPVTLRLYASFSNPAMPAPLKKYAERVRWLLEEFAAASKGRVSLIVIDPEQDSIDEEAAMMDSILPRQTAAGDRLFLGVSATRADSVAAIPFLAPEQEALLEYEIARIVLSAVSEERPAVGVISPLKVLGVKTDLSRIRQSPSSAPVRMEPAWYTMSELSRNYDLRELAEDVPAIPADIKALLIINPVKLSPRTLYAIDQFLLRGGKAAVFLDPRSFYAALKSRTDYSLLDKLESDLQPLLPAWGIAWNPAMMVADMVSAYRKTLPDRMVTNPMALNLAPARITRANPLFANLNEISMYFTGFFHIVPREGVEYETLLTSSPESQIVSSLLGNRPELVIKNFKSADREYPLAVRLRGRLNTAYPGGAPDRSALPAGHAHLAKGVREAEIYLFSDSDMLFNDVCVTAYSDAFGTRSYRRSNDNVAMLQNVMESLTGSRMLASIRNRVPMSRPLTKINTLKAEAELKYKNRILELERDFTEAQARLNALRRAEETPDAPGAAERRKEMRSFQLKVASARRELKEMRASLKRDLDSLDTRIKILNIIVVPALLALIGIGWSVIRFSIGRRKR
ncbi:MAG: Gldg family protein [Victivallales bacterium]